MELKIYQSPKIEIIKIDTEISLILSSGEAPPVSDEEALLRFDGNPNKEEHFWA